MNRKLTFHWEDRPSIKPGVSFLILAGSVAAGLVCLGLIFALNGKNPVFALTKIFTASFGSFFGWEETLTKALPLILTGAGLTLAYRGKFWNIGAEGQLLAGAMAATWAGLSFGFLPSFVLIPLMFIAGFFSGALWGAVAAILKVRFRINEVISTLMLNYILFEVLKFLVVGPWRGASQHGYPYTDDLGAQAVLSLIPGTRISPVLAVLALVGAVVLFFLVYRTKFGYEVRVMGENPEAARYAGISFAKTTILVMVISGGMAGLAGVGEAASNIHHMTFPEAVTSGYGFTAIIVAWLAKLNPLLTLFSAVFFAGILVGGDAIQISLGLPAATVQVFNGVMLLFLIVSEYFARNRLVVLWKGERLWKK